MPSFNRLVTASVSLGSLKASIPETVSFTGATGNQLFGYFNGWTSSLTLTTTNCTKLPSESLLAPLTVFTAAQEVVTCDWIQQQVEIYKAYDDVFEEAFLQSKFPKLRRKAAALGLRLNEMTVSRLPDQWQFVRHRSSDLSGPEVRH